MGPKDVSSITWVAIGGARWFYDWRLKSERERELKRERYLYVMWSVGCQLRTLVVAGRAFSRLAMLPGVGLSSLHVPGPWNIPMNYDPDENVCPRPRISRLSL